jgi:hypothetical protein
MQTTDPDQVEYSGLKIRSSTLTCIKLLDSRLGSILFGFVAAPAPLRRFAHGRRLQSRTGRRRENNTFLSSIKQHHKSENAALVRYTTPSLIKKGNCLGGGRERERERERERVVVGATGNARGGRGGECDKGV